MKDVEQIARVLAADSGAGPVHRIVPLKGGGNNRVYLVEADSKLLLKLYFHHADDTRNRLESEFFFSRFAWNHGVRGLPQPLACDVERRAGLYEFIDGRLLTLDEITEERVAEALDFFCEINVRRFEGNDLPNASEACFSISQHLKCVEHRVERLRQIERSTESQRDASDLVESQLLPVWSTIAKAASLKARDLAPQREVAADERCLSPSDFGFHNAICGDDDRLRFIDFEYSGWDDPAKMVCDFFCQPSHPVPRRMMGEFIQTLGGRFPDLENLTRRIEILFPVYQLKWCCILFNEFVPTSRARRRFADESISQSSRERRQVEKVRHVLGELRHEADSSQVMLQT